MIYENYGLRLVRVKSEHIELIRYWRNHDSIKQFMEYKETITAEMQKKWFRSIQSTPNLFLLVEYDHNFVGLVNGKNIDFEKGTAEGGVFIWDINFHNTELPIRSLLALADFAFLFCNIKNCYIKILKENKKSIEMNKIFGYKLVEGEENKENQLYVVGAQDFLKSTLYYKKHYKKVYKEPAKITFQKDDFEGNWANFYLENFCDENNTHKDFLIEIEM